VVKKPLSVNYAGYIKFNTKLLHVFSFCLGSIYASSHYVNPYVTYNLRYDSIRNMSKRQIQLFSRKFVDFQCSLKFKYHFLPIAITTT